VSLGTNQGHGPARNRGISEAIGDYLVFVDADDELAADALARIARKITHTRADLYLLTANEVRPSGIRTVGASRLFDELSASSTTCTTKTRPDALLWPAATWSKVYRREFIASRHISFPTGYHQDIPWSISTTLFAESIGAVPDISYRYLRHGVGSSTTTSRGTKTLERITQVQRVRSAINVSALSDGELRYLVAVIAIHLISGVRAAYRTMPQEHHEQYFSDSAEELAWWWARAQPGAEVNSDALLPTKERIVFTKALLSNDWAQWNKTLENHKRALKWQRYLDPTRWGIFKRS
jgi:glycosyltransferase involved in cell wall biosynthesis